MVVVNWLVGCVVGGLLGWVGRLESASAKGGGALLLMLVVGWEHSVFCQSPSIHNPSLVASCNQSDLEARDGDGDRRGHVLHLLFVEIEDERRGGVVVGLVVAAGGGGGAGGRRREGVAREGAALRGEAEAAAVGAERGGELHRQWVGGCVVGVLWAWERHDRSVDREPVESIPLMLSAKLAPTLTYLAPIVCAPVGFPILRRRPRPQQGPEGHCFARALPAALACLTPCLCIDWIGLDWIDRCMRLAGTGRHKIAWASNRRGRLQQAQQGQQTLSGPESR